MKALFGEVSSSSVPTEAPPSASEPSPERIATEASSGGVKEGWLMCKVAATEGKKATDRAWKSQYVVLKGQILSIYKDTRTALEQPSFCEEPSLDLTTCRVEVADDYADAKRAHVFRVRTGAGFEYLFQAETDAAMHEWAAALDAGGGGGDEDEGRQQQQQQRKERSAARKTEKTTAQAATTTTAATSRNRSPSTHSPATKARKASADQFSGKDGSGGKDKKTWKGKMARQWKKMQHGSNPSANPTFPEGGSIGVPLELCPLCEDDDADRVPLLVKTCCSMVEERGLEIVGVYRVPGNSAAVNNLTEQVNTMGADTFLRLDDPRWQDVNVVSSLLKSFFRKLPEPLFTSDLYSAFIETSKVEEATTRLHLLKKLVRALPDVHYETLRYVIRHLCKVIEHADVNKMEVRNLAIMFGPTLVRTADDNMLTMVTDMSQQCRIIESLLNNCGWFFGDESTGSAAGDVAMAPAAPEPAADVVEEPPQRAISQTGNETLLLNNLQKLEEAGKVASPGREVSAKDIVSGIISAANRKMQRAAKSKKESLDLTDGSVLRREQRLDTPTRAMLAASAAVGAAAASSSAAASASNSRRNSESVIHSAMTIAAAVPQLMGGVAGVGAPEPASVSSATNIPARLGLDLKPALKQMSVSAENITRMMTASTTTTTEESRLCVEATTASSSVTRAETMTTTSSAMTTEMAAAAADDDAASKSKYKFPIDTYHGLEEATAQRVKQFEEETNAMLKRSRLEAGLMHSASGPFSPSSDLLDCSRSSPSTSASTWPNDDDLTAGGILLQEPYHPRPAAVPDCSSGGVGGVTRDYRESSPSDVNDAPDRFLNLTYIAPSRPHGGKMVRGLSLGSLAVDNDEGSESKKAATTMTMPRHSRQPSPKEVLAEREEEKGTGTGETRPTFWLGAEEPGRRLDPVAAIAMEADVEAGKEEEEEERSGDFLTSITASFDEKLRLLLDPHYQATTSKQVSASASATTTATASRTVQEAGTMGQGQGQGQDQKQEGCWTRSSGERRRQASTVLNTKDNVHASFTTSSTSTAVALASSPSSSSTTAMCSSTISVSTCSSSSRKTDLRRGRLVDKKREPPVRSPVISVVNNQLRPSSHPSLKRGDNVNAQTRQRHSLESSMKRGDNNSNQRVPPQASLKRSDSLTKREKQSANQRRKKQEEKENAEQQQQLSKQQLSRQLSQQLRLDAGASGKLLKTLTNQRRSCKIRRRHTVGGTRDFGGLDGRRRRPYYDKNSVAATSTDDEDVADEDVVRTAAVFRQQQNQRTSSPDLLFHARMVPVVTVYDDDDDADDNRRLSLPESVMEMAVQANLRLASSAWLESQV